MMNAHKLTKKLLIIILFFCLMLPVSIRADQTTKNQVNWKGTLESLNDINGEKKVKQVLSKIDSTIVLFYDSNFANSRNILQLANSVSLKIQLVNAKLHPQVKSYLLENYQKVKFPCLFIYGTPMYDHIQIIQNIVTNSQVSL